MTNERLEYWCRNVNLDNAKWPMPDEVAVVDFYDPRLPDFLYDDFIVLFDKGERVGAVLPMGNVDLHCLTLPEHQGKGHMSKFLRTGIIKLLRPKLVKVTTDKKTLEENDLYAKLMAEKGTDSFCALEEEWCQNFEDEAEERKKIEHLMSLAGIRVFYCDGGDYNKYDKGGAENIKAPVICPYCKKSHDRSWGWAVVYGSYNKATDSTYYIVNCEDHDCPHCGRCIDVRGGIIEHPVGVCSFSTLIGDNTR